MLACAQQAVTMPEGPEPGPMRIAVVVLLLLAISGGSVLATIHRRGRVPAWQLALAHGALGLSALVLAFVDLSRADAVTALPIIALTCLILTAVVAFVFFVLRLMRKKVPGRLIAVHAAFGASAFVVLLVDTFGGA